MQACVAGVPDLEKRKGALYWLIAGESDEKDRDALIARTEKNFKHLRRGQDAADMRAFGVARREIQNLLPSEKEDWLRKNWSGSKQGYERALAELTEPTGVQKRATPMETRMVQTLEYVLQKGQMSDQDLIGSTLWQLGLFPARLDDLRHNIGAWERKRRAAEEDPDPEKSGLAGLAGLVGPAVDKRVQADADALLDAVENGTVGEWKAALDAADRGETGVLVAANGPLDGILSGEEETGEIGTEGVVDKETAIMGMGANPPAYPPENYEDLPENPEMCAVAETMKKDEGLMRQIEDLHEKSEESGLEYGGWIVKDPSGGYSIPEVKVGTEKEVALGELPPNTIGSVHVHPHILSASPSPRDQASAQANPNVDINITLSGFGDAAYLDNKGEQFRCEGPYNWFAQEEK